MVRNATIEIRSAAMAIWLVRAGAHGQFEEKFLSEKRVYVTWDRFNIDIGAMEKRDELIKAMTDSYPDSKHKTILNWVSQLWAFAHRMSVGDWIVMPSKQQPSIFIGEITGHYEFDLNGTDPFFHWRSVTWIGESVPRSHFGQDLLYSFGAFLTICQIKRNDAEQRLKVMRADNWAPESDTAVISPSEDQGNGATEPESTDLDEVARDQISRLIEARFKGHRFTRMVNAILEAKGYSTFVSQEGADGGADILAGNGPMGFGDQQICVEVKSGSEPIGREVADKLLGAVDKFRATQGLLVSWGGFRSNVQRELASSFFKLRLWGRAELLEQLFESYEELDDELKAELPLKRIWTVALNED